MICIHGKEVKAIIQKQDPKYWDDGYKEYDENGKRKMDGDYILVEGCDECKVIKCLR